MDKMKWFQEARFGMFVHWGLYSLLGGSFEGQKSPKLLGEWIMKDLKIPLEKYRKLSENFNPVQWDAERVVRLCKESGMKYLCFTAKHHDGFAMYESKVSDYNIMHTPYGKDILRELQYWCGQYGIVLCIYYSQMQDWEHPDGWGNDWDFDVSQKNFERYYREKVCPQVTELLQNYGDIGMIWFDTPYDMPKELCEDLRDLVHSLQPQCIINGRIGYNLGDYFEAGDNCMPACAWNCDWELPMTLNKTWGYRADDEAWKSAGQVIEALALTASKGGNLLLNIGPDAMGRVPQKSVEILHEVGCWMSKCGESIYGTQASPPFPYLTPWGCFTMRGNTLYMHLYRYPEGGGSLKVYGFLTKARSVRSLVSGKDISFHHFYDRARDEKRIYLELPAKPDDPSDTVLVIELEEKLKTAAAPTL